MSEQNQTTDFINSKLDAMNDELEQLKDSHPNSHELDEFKELYIRYLESKGAEKDWDLIKTVKDEVKNHSQLPECQNSSEILNKLIVIKLNGGLGTTMGLTKPKGLIKVRDGHTFIDLVIKQLKHFNKECDAKIPLLLMTSFNTEKATKQLIKGRENVKTFNQSMYPRISYDTKLPITGKGMYYPPGHGDIFISLNDSGLLDELINQGKEYAFISNIDNLGATIDLKLLNELATTKTDFLIELTEKTMADIKGGTLINYNGKLEILEIAMVPCEHKKDFTSIVKFKNFNTNSVWVNLKMLKKKIKDLEALPIIENKKTLEDGRRVIQLETSLSSAIQFFENAEAVFVDRSRFTPVKSCTDLFLVESDLYKTENALLVKNEKRRIPGAPKIKFISPHFNKLESFIQAFPEIPNIVDLEELIIHGDVKFGHNITLKGTIIIVADGDKQLTIPDGAVLEDSMITGSCIIETLK